MSVNWEKHLRRFYQKHNPSRLPDIPMILAQFAGLEESLWFSICQKYGQNVNDVDIEPLVVSKTASLKQRVIRIYGHYKPSKLVDVDKTMKLMEKETPGKVFTFLLDKYGPEPPLEYTNIRERCYIMFATYNKLERLGQVDELLALYEGMEESLIRRLVNELGPEPHASDLGDPREPRQRLRRFLTVYDNVLLPKLEVILARYEENSLQLFVTMQRRYGREPTELDVRVYLEKKEAERRRKKNLEESQIKSSSGMGRTGGSGETEEGDRGVSEQSRIALLEQQKAAMKLNADSASDLSPMQNLPQETPRDSSVLKVRTHLEYGDNLSQENMLQLLVELFRAYDRSMVPVAPKFIKNRFGSVNECGEVLSMLDNMYINAIVRSNLPSLRSIVSLLELKLGASFDEVWTVGGVEPFLVGIDPRSHADWAVFLITMRGKATETELATRNRLRAHYLFYNPDVPVAEVDQVLSTFGNNQSSMYEALLRHYGPEPNPLAIDVERVEKILAKNAPDKLPQIGFVIEAHCCVGDTPEDVIRKIVRTYGPEPSLFDALFNTVLLEEVEERFQIYASQLRLRDIVIRRRAAIGQGGDIAGVYKLIESNTEAAAQTKLLSSSVNQYMSDLQEEERHERSQLYNAREVEFREIMDVYVSVIDYWEEDKNVELAELLRRHTIEDEAVCVFPSLLAEMVKEETELLEWLNERLLWREKWKRDDERKIQLKFEEEKRKFEEAHRELPSVDTSVSQKHLQDMDLLYQQLNNQAKKVLYFNSAVEQYRRSATNVARVASTVAPSRVVHHTCAFHNPEYSVVEPAPSELTKAKRQMAQMETDWNLQFQQQCLDYIQVLFRRFESSRIGTGEQLLKRYEGKEIQLISALEAQYNVNQWRQRNLREKLTFFYQRRCPDATEEIELLIQKFQHREDLLWEYVSSRHGPVPRVFVSPKRNQSPHSSPAPPRPT